ncbi:unnamed protein product [Cuscuta campestris]|uniref:Uncharacterized protein n=1 Tax=Cuscuta campestris TaxID=132261 RepID=A0A484M3R9_9ASTE|nr:unnamed protein product [Cuscuta campestris]
MAIVYQLKDPATRDYTFTPPQLPTKPPNPPPAQRRHPILWPPVPKQIATAQIHRSDFTPPPFLKSYANAFGIPNWLHAMETNMTRYRIMGLAISFRARLTKSINTNDTSHVCSSI